eukprot:s3817_g12.t1
MDLHFVWQAWHLRHWAGSGDALGLRWARFGAAPLLRARRGTWRHLPSFCVAGVALGDMDLHFVWQAWHSVTWTFTLCGRRGTCGTGLALVTLGRRCDRRGTWRGTYGTGLALVTRLVGAGAGLAPRFFCVAGVALGDICRRFV